MRRLLEERGLALLAELGGMRTLLAFDYDGTLAPIVEDRNRAGMRPETHALLAKVCALYPTAIISGRARPDVRKLIKGVHAKYVIGNHGLDKGHESLATVKALDVPRMKLAVLAARTHGMELEDKRYSLTVHYRKVRDKPAARAAVLLLLEQLSCPVRIVPGKAVLNVVLEGTPHKGDALLALTELEGVERALYVGDDSTDEDVFRLDAHGLIVGVRVGRTSHSAAKWFLGKQAEMDALLRVLIKARRHKHPHRSV
ncbi:MAG TPA: trehalose-phosphatase [Archangium sp.]